MEKQGEIYLINGPVIKAKKMTGFKMMEMVMVGDDKLIGEIIELHGDSATIQVYEETSGLKPGEPVYFTGKPLSLQLGPGVLTNMFDGIQRPLKRIEEMAGHFIPRGIGLFSIEMEKEWDVTLVAQVGDSVKGGDTLYTVQETDLILHKVMVPPNLEGKILDLMPTGRYKTKQVLAHIETKNGIKEIKMYQEWPVRTARPISKRRSLSRPLITGQRILDTFFPVAKGGAAALPGGFGAGKTVTQHQLAKWSDADIIVYIGCGERGNEMTDVLNEFPKLIDPKSNKPLMDRTVLIANTSNMPVAAREASVYTGITMAEFYRDMGYHVAIMADSTSRWAEALRELSGRLEEMPAEEGFPAYLASRLAQFYERAGYVENLNGTEGSVTIIGAVSPQGGDFSEPVTQNTKRFVGSFWALDKNLAYARHFPAINWLVSYTEYMDILEDWFKENVSAEFISYRNRAMELLYEEDKLQEIVKLVGEDVLPDDQRLVLEAAKLIKVGFLQQSVFNKVDTYVTLQKQFAMLKTIVDLYDQAYQVVKLGAPISVIKNAEIFDEIIKLKFTVPNEEVEKVADLQERVQAYYTDIMQQYKK